MLSVDRNIFTSILNLYGRTENNFEEDVTTIRNWIKTQPHLPETMDDSRIRNFLLSNKCSVERTKQKIDNYYTMREMMKEFSFSLDSEEGKKSIEIVYASPLPKLKNLTRVNVIKLRNPELLEELHPKLVCGRVLYILEILLKEDFMFKQILIADLDGFNLSYLLKITPAIVYKVISIYERVFSNRLEALYIINSFPAVDAVLNIMKRVMKPKLFQRIYVCKGSRLLQENFSKEILPKDYGGEEKSLAELHELWEETLSKYKNWFDELFSMRVKEELRPEKLRDEELFGFYGNFKTLSVD